jgi:signal transduction histidine kinase
MQSMQLRALWRTTSFRLSILYGLLFALGTIALLGMVYLRSVVFLTQRVDGILKTEASALVSSPWPGLRQRLTQELKLYGNRNNVFALFSGDGTPLAGNLAALPAGLHPGGKPVEVGPTTLFPANARLIAFTLPYGQILVVGRDVSQLREMRTLIASALIWSGTTIILVGLACGTALGFGPVQRLRLLEAAAQEIARGDLTRRMPVSERHDELDTFAATVNHMMGEIERLMSEVQGATETIAHDLLTPLSRAHVQLRRLQQAESIAPADIAQVMAGLDELLERFRAILRISELDARQRRAGFSRVDLMDIVTPAAELYQPLAEAGGVTLHAAGRRGSMVESDPKLLFEAISNLIDNAIKFSGRGGTVHIRVGEDPSHPCVIVQDDGPGIPAAERSAVLQRFYRAERHRSLPGSGLGLSVVQAILRLHGFELLLDDAAPGVRAIIDTQPVGTQPAAVH